MNRKIRQIKKLPNWKEPDDYKWMNSLALDQWAWEFLKRNQKYLEQWSRLTNHLTEDQKFVQDWLELMLYDRAFTPELRDASRWGLNHGYLNPHPSIEYSGIPFIPPGGTQWSMVVSGEYKGTNFIGLPCYDTGEVILRFNFNEPINPQLRAAKKELKKLQRKSIEKGNKTRKAFKPRFSKQQYGKDEWILLIRILDAVSASASDKEIAEALFPDVYLPDAIKTVYDKKEQAKRYADQDYRLIPFSEE